MMLTNSISVDLELHKFRHWCGIQVPGVFLLSFQISKNIYFAPFHPRLYPPVNSRLAVQNHFNLSSCVNREFPQTERGNAYNYSILSTVEMSVSDRMPEYIDHCLV